MNKPRKPDAGPRVRLVSAPWSSLYDLPVDALVEEQDRHRLLGLDARPPRTDVAEYPELVQLATEASPAGLGDLLSAGGRPLRLMAILLDLDAGRSVDPAHLHQVAERLARTIESRSIRRLGLPVLGGVHGDASVAAFAATFAPRLRAGKLETLYLLAGPNPTTHALRRLRDAFDA